MGAATDDYLQAFIGAESLPQSFCETVARVHWPLAEWILARQRECGRPILVGICGPQGSGKSTAASVLQNLLERMGKTTAVVSLDDFYLTKAERAQLARNVHPLLSTRGPPGTHDVDLGEVVIERLMQGASSAVPAFDKVTDDRRPEGDWKYFAGPADIVLFEGWCVDARAQEEAALVAPINDLERNEDPDGVWRAFVNAAIAEYQDLFRRIDTLVMLRAPDFAAVTEWRKEQETKLRGRIVGLTDVNVMNDAEVERFVQHYERLTRHILVEMPERADVVIELAQDRALVRFAVRRENGRCGGGSS